MPRGILLRVGLATVLGGVFTSNAGAGMIDLTVHQWDGNVAIPDDDPDGAYAEIIVPLDEDDGDPLISDLNVDVIVQHPRQGDLILRLERVFNGETVLAVELMNRPGDGAVDGGFTAANIGNPVAEPDDGDRFFFDDEAVAGLYDAPNVSTPGTDNVTGPWVPENALSAFDNQPKWATWRLYVTDAESGETGEIRSFSLHFGPVPEPATAGLLIAGAFVLSRRRRHAA